MKIINDKGKQKLQEIFPINISWNKQHQFFFPKSKLNTVKNILLGKFSYKTEGQSIVVSYPSYEKYLQVDCFDEIRGWSSKDCKWRASEMEQQHLSNCLGYFELVVELNKISTENANNYLKALQTDILPEIQERFNGEVLPYTPFYDFEKQMVKERELLRK